jgi:hypothetical protein
MTGNPTNIHFHARLMMIEQIMQLIGRSSKDPKRYRRILASQDSETLRRTWHKLQESTLADFPALELTTACDEPRRIQSVDGSARDPLTPQSVLP